MNPNLAQQSIALARQRLQGRQVPRGAAHGAVAGQVPMQQAPMQPVAQAPMQQVPQGADQGNLAGCGDGGCATGRMESPFAGMQNVNTSHVTPNALLGIFVQPATAQPTTLEIACGGTFFNACGARAFTPAGTNLLTSIISGFDTRDQLCPGSGIDVAFFTTDDCYCPFDFGCFSNLAPLQITFDPIDTQSVLQPLNMILVGDRLEFDGCFPFPPGMYPQPQMPAGVRPPGAAGSFAPAPQANPGWGGWGQRGY